MRARRVSLLKKQPPVVGAPVASPTNAAALTTIRASRSGSNGGSRTGSFSEHDMPQFVQQPREHQQQLQAYDRPKNATLRSRKGADTRSVEVYNLGQSNRPMFIRLIDSKGTSCFCFFSL